MMLILSTLLSCVACSPKASTSSPDATTPVDTAPENGPETDEGLSVKLMTFNLRYDTTSHICMSTEIRGAHLMEVIKKYAPDSVSFNEATNDWMNYLRVEMKKLGYEGVGVGRDNGETGNHLTGSGNEHSPVFYRADKFDLLDSDTFWLSTTPDKKGSVSWNSACKRVCSYAVLKDKESGGVYAHFGTHLDHVSIPAQYNGVMVIETYINSVLEKFGDIGIALSGDFNCVRFDNSNPSYVPTTYNTVTSFMDDSRDLATQKGIDSSSWSGFQSPTDWEKGHVSMDDKPAVDTTSSPIDYIFLQKGTAIVSYYTIVNDVFTFDYKGKTWYNHPISDHYGVFCEATFKSPSSSITYSEDKIAVYPAKTVVSDTVPQKLKDVAAINENISVKSNLKIQNGTKIEDLLSNTTSLVKANTQGYDHCFWEITLSAADPFEFNGISVTTPGGAEIIPKTLRVFASNDGSEWARVGGTVADVNGTSTYYVIPQKTVTTKYVKILFSDVSYGAGLSSVSVFGKLNDTGRIDNSEITLISGPTEKGNKEGYEKMFDNDLSTKFYIRLYADNAVPANPDPIGAICFSTKTPTTVTSYALTNGNDTASHTGRIPRKWTLYGSVSGAEGTYEIIDQVTNPNISTVNYETFTFKVDNPKEYQYYKIVFEVGRTGNVQFSEIAFFQAAN